MKNKTNYATFSSLLLLTFAPLLMVLTGQSAAAADYSTNSYGTKLLLSWDPGCEFNQFGQPNPGAHGTELWGAWSLDGFKSGPSWSNLLSGASTERFRIADIPSPGESIWMSMHPGTIFVTVYAYFDSTPYTTTNFCYDQYGEPVTNINAYPSYRTRSEPANILQIDVPSPKSNVRLLSTETVSDPATNLVQLFEVDITGTSEKYFTLRMEITNRVEVTNTQLARTVSTMRSATNLSPPTPQ